MKHRKLEVNHNDVIYLQYQNLEKGFERCPQNEDMMQYLYLKAGNPLGIEIAAGFFNADLQGCLSKDPLRNIKYLFVVNTGLASRFAVEGGLPVEIAYSISDLYIQKMDELETIEEVKQLQRAMFTHYTKQVALFKRNHVCSKPIVQCLEYISSHLSERISLEQLADFVNLSPSYLSTLFKQEMRETVSDYITKIRIETAKNMLNHSEYSYAQISSALAFSSQSHFTKVFRQKTGYTPREYRMQFYSQDISTL